MLLRKVAGTPAAEAAMETPESIDLSKIEMTLLPPGFLREVQAACNDPHSLSLIIRNFMGQAKKDEAVRLAESKNFMNSVAEGIAMEIATELWLEEPNLIKRDVAEQILEYLGETYNKTFAIRTIEDWITPVVAESKPKGRPRKQQS